MHTNKPQIFVTNDDGIHAKGLQVLIEEMCKIGDVLAIAPSEGKSGMSHAITFSTPLRMKNHVKSQELETYDLSGTPVDCVKMGLDKFYVRNNPQLLVSGINHGSNASICSIYSGTVAAAREGAINGIPSIAFSNMDFSHDANLDYFRPYLSQIAKFVLLNPLPAHVFLNVNFPSHDIQNIKGIRVCAQTKGIWVEEFDARKDPNNTDYYWLTGHFENYEPENKLTDEYLLAQNYITVVPIRIESTAIDALEMLEKINI